MAKEMERGGQMKKKDKYPGFDDDITMAGLGLLFLAFFVGVMLVCIAIVSLLGLIQ